MTGCWVSFNSLLVPTVRSLAFHRIGDGDSLFDGLAGLDFGTDVGLERRLGCGFLEGHRKNMMDAISLASGSSHSSSSSESNGNIVVSSNPWTCHRT